ncbi:hypothetical protein ACHAW6_004813 [Cyclotella cf. meneghiniana]
MEDVNSSFMGQAVKSYTMEKSSSKGVETQPLAYGNGQGHMDQQQTHINSTKSSPAGPSPPELDHMITYEQIPLQ